MILILSAVFRTFARLVDKLKYYTLMWVAKTDYRLAQVGSPINFTILSKLLTTNRTHQKSKKGQERKPMLFGKVFNLFLNIQRYSEKVLSRSTNPKRRDPARFVK